MKKIIIFFFPFLILFHCGMYLVFDMISTDESPMMTMLRVERGGKPMTGTLRFHPYDMPGNKNVDLAFYLAELPVEFTSLDILDSSGAVVFTVPASVVTGNGNLHIDLDGGGIVGKVPFGAYFTGITRVWGILGYLSMILMAGPFTYFVTIIAPLAFIAMIYSIIREKKLGLKRGFSGSYFRLFLGLAILIMPTIVIIGVILFFNFAPAEMLQEIGQEMDINEVVEELAVNRFPLIFYGFYFIVGFGFYGTACRSFEPAKHRAKLHRKMDQDYHNATNFSYTVYRWSDGSVTDDRLDIQAANFAWLALKSIIKTAFLPVTTFVDMTKFYLVPILDGDPIWKKYNRWVAAQNSNTPPPQESRPAPPPPPPPQGSRLPPLPPPPMNAPHRVAPTPMQTQLKEQPAVIGGKCSACGTVLSGKGRFCPGCGAKLTP